MVRNISKRCFPQGLTTKLPLRTTTSYPADRDLQSSKLASAGEQPSPRVGTTTESQREDQWLPPGTQSDGAHPTVCLWTPRMLAPVAHLDPHGCDWDAIPRSATINGPPRLHIGQVLVSSDTNNLLVVRCHLHFRHFQLPFSRCAFSVSMFFSLWPPLCPALSTTMCSTFHYINSSPSP